MNYDAQKEYNLFRKYLQKVSTDGKTGAISSLSTQDQVKANQLNKKLAEESSNNKKISERRTGEQILYGDELQLLHLDSQSFLEGSKNCADIDKSCNMIKLNPEGSKALCFIVEPRYKYRNLGSPVNYGDVVVFKNVKSKQYLHISARDVQMPKGRAKSEIPIRINPQSYKNIVYSQVDRRMLPDEFAALYEVNTASNRSNFTIRPYRSFIDEQQSNVIKGGSVVRFLHSESGGYICSDDNDFTGDDLAEVFLWKFKGKSSDIEALSTQSFFELEIVSDVNSSLGRITQYSGNSSDESSKSGGMHFRLRHFNTGRLVVMQELEFDQVYLTVGLSEHLGVNIVTQKQGLGTKCVLSVNNAEYMKSLEENSIFRFVSTGVDMESGIISNTSVQIQHVASGRFLQHNNKIKFIKPKEQPNTNEEDEQPHIVADDKKKLISNHNTEPTKELEILHPHFFRKLDNQYIDLGSRDLVTLEDNASFENAFFIATEPMINIKRLLFVHTSVNCLNNLLPEISNPDYGQSKERQHKIESIIKSMINWIDEDDEAEIQGEQDLYRLDMPYSLKYNDEFSRKKRLRQVKQSFMRELRVFECLVDFLYMPFISGAFDFKTIQQDEAITSLCKLVYQLLSKIVSGYRLNEIYASQWIGLYINHILQSSDNNSIGADKFVEQMCDENEIILKDMITDDVLLGFFRETEKGQEQPRMLRLLKSLCAVQSGPIRKIQLKTLSILLEDEESRLKLLMPLKRIKRSKPIEICLDLKTNNWVNFNEFVQKRNTIHRNFNLALQRNPNATLSQSDLQILNEYDCFICLLDLLAECCLERNTENQNKLKELFEGKILRSIFQDKKLDSLIRSKTLQLYLEAYLNVDPFQMKRVPTGFAVWKSLPELEFTDEQNQQSIQDKIVNYLKQKNKVKLPNKIIELKEVMQQILDQVQGLIHPTDQEKNELTIVVLKTVKFMILHGFYQTQEEFNQVARLVDLFLNGANVYKKKKTIDVDVVISQHDEEMMARQRYFPESVDDPIILSKLLAQDILLVIQNFSTDAKCIIYLSKLKQDIKNTIQNKNNSNSNRYQQRGQQLQTQKSKVVPEQSIVPQKIEGVSVQEDLNLLKLISEVKSDEGNNETLQIAILFDLLLYRQIDLQCKAFKMIVNYFTRQRIIIECLSQTQILESSNSIKTMKEIKNYQIELKRQQQEMQYWLQVHNEQAQKDKQSVAKIFENLKNFCVLEEAKADLNQHNSDSDDIMSKGESKNISQSEKRKQAQADKIKETQNKIEQFMIFEIDKNNAIPNKENQRLIQSFYIAEIALIIIKQKVDRFTSSNPEYIELIKSCYRFLVSYTRNNFQNQLKIYDDIDIFMRDIDKYWVATLLFYEIFKDNKKFLTLNVTKFIRAINNTAEEIALGNIRKAIYLKLLEVFCRFKNQLIKQNQIEIVIQMTSDITRSNVLYLFQSEGAKELSIHIEKSLEIKYSKSKENSNITDIQNDLIHDENNQEITAKDNEDDASQNLSLKLKQTQSSLKRGTQEMSIEIFNVIQLLQLVTLCCTGKIEFTETKCKENILNFKSATNMIVLSRDLWPLKIAIFEYIIATYMDSSDPKFMKKPQNDEQQEEDEVTEGAVDNSDMGILLKLIELLNADYQDYLDGNVKNNKFKMPNGNLVDMKVLNEKFIFGTGLNFIKATLKRKTYDVGSVELKFYVLAKKIAETFYKTSNTQNKKAVYHLLDYIFKSDKHRKYLDNVKHPAKKGRSNVLIYEQLGLNQQIQEDQVQQEEELTNSNRLSQRITQLANSQEMQTMKENEFINLVDWITQIDSYIKQKLGPINSKPFLNLDRFNIISSLLRLLDAKVLSKELQMTGISILRKIIEMENKKLNTPSADWESDEWLECRRIIETKQNFLVERGTIEFICKHISETEDMDVQEECILLCISLVIGGNPLSQKTFFEYMKMVDTENNFLLTIKTMLVRNFELTKKFMIEKNAKLLMIYNFKNLKNPQRDNKKQPNQEKENQGEEDPNIQENQSQVDEDDEKENLFKLDIDEEDSQEEVQEQVDKPITIEKLEESAKKKYLATTIRILKFLQLLCEGHYSDLQNNLREQINASGLKSNRSFDFVAYVSNMFTIYVKSYVNCYSTNLGNQIIELLIEFIQGPCSQSQKTLVDTKAIDCCRDLLNQGNDASELDMKGFGGNKKALLNDIKMNSVKLLLSILEGPVDIDISTRISASLGDFQVVIHRMKQIYEQFLEEELKLPIDSPPQKIQNSLQIDSFEGCILEGFDIYSLLNQLVEVIPEDQEKLKPYKDQVFYQFFIRNSGNIEVNTQFDVLRIYFPLQPKCRFLTEKTKSYFSRTVERESGQHKLIGLCENIPGFEEEMEHLEIMSHQKLQMTPDVLNYMRDFSTLIALIIGILLVSNYQYQYTTQQDSSQNYNSYIHPTANQVIFGVGCIQAFTSFMLLVGFLINNANLIIRVGWRDRVSVNQIEMLIEKKEIQNLRENSLTEIKVSDLSISLQRTILQLEGPYSSVFYDPFTKKLDFGGISMQFEYYWTSLTFMISNGQFLFMVIYFVFSIQGLLQSPVFYSFHLLDVINKFPALQNVIRAVTLNGNQILMAGMLGAILIYNFTVVIFLFTYDNFTDQYGFAFIDNGIINRTGISVCMSLFHCYCTALNYGLRYGGGLGDAMPIAPYDEENLQLYYIKFFMDVAFFLLVNTIILNIFFGIIIDSFAQLREESAFTENDVKNVCFMCNLDRYIVDKDTDLGFDYHIQYDHNVWNYLYFIIHLKQKDPSDFNGTESSIYQCFQNDDMSWFPQHKSIRMKQTLEARKTHEVLEESDVMEQMSEMVSKIDLSLCKLEQI